MPELSGHIISNVVVTDNAKNSLMLSITNNKNQSVKALIDSGAQSCYMSSQLAQEWKVPIKRLPKPIFIWNVDGTRNKSKAMTHYTIIPIKTDGVRY